jgi:cell volume regulation protein A
VLFIVLGLLVFPRDLPSVALPGLALAALPMLVARPAAVWVSTAFVDFTHRERLLIGWAGLRGAVLIVLATFVLSSDVPHKATIFNAVFFVVLVSATIQGTTLERVAERLRLASPRSPSDDVASEPGELGNADLVNFAVAASHAVNGSTVRELGLPRDVLIAIVNRNGKAIRPRGSTRIEAGDQLVVFVPRERRADLEDVLVRWRRRV